MAYFTNPEDGKTYFVPDADVPEEGIRTAKPAQKMYQGKPASDELIAYAAANPGKINFVTVSEFGEPWKEVSEEELVTTLRNQGFEKV